MIKKNCIFYSLIIMILSINFSLAMQIDFNDQEYINQKEQLFKAVENNNLTETKKQFRAIDDKLRQKFTINYSSTNYYKSVRPKYLENLINIPLDTGKSIINAALNNHNLNIIYFLLSEDNKSFKFASVLDDHLIKLINPITDATYLDLKMKLLDAIEKDPKDAKEIAKKFQHSIKEEFIPNKAENGEVTKYFNQKIWPLYLKDLIKPVFDKQNFDVVYLLLEYPHNYLAYLKTQHIEPSDDPIYQNIKEKLIQAVENNRFKQMQKLLNNLSDEMKNKYIPFELTSSNDWRNTIDLKNYYASNIAPIYSFDLLSTLIPIAVKNDNFAILYSLLKTLNDSTVRARDKIIEFVEKLSHLEEIIQLNNQPIIDAFDNLIISSITILIGSPNLISFLTILRDNGYERTRLENSILKASAIVKIYLKSPNTIDQLVASHFIKDKDKFKAAYDKYREFLDNAALITTNSALGNNTAASNDIDKIKEDEINTKYDEGNTLLITTLDTVRDENGIGLIKKLIAKKANVNQAGTGGITPLMYVAKEALGDLPDKIRLEIINILLDHGADPNAKDIFDKTALDYSRETGNNEIIKLLEQHTKLKPVQLSIPEQILVLNNLNSSLSSLANKV